MTPEQRYRLEKAKDNTPSTSVFVWFIPAIILIAFITRTEPGKEIVTMSHHEYDTCILGWCL